MDNWLRAQLSMSTWAKSVTATLVGVCIAGCSSLSHSAECDRYLAKAQDALTAEDYSHAREWLGKAALEADRSESQFSKPRVLKSQAAVAVADGKLKDCEDYSLQLLNVYGQMIVAAPNRMQRSELVEDSARASVVLGDCLSEQKRYDDALKVYQSAQRKLTDAGGDIVLQGKISSRIAGISEKMNRSDESIGVERELLYGSDVRMARHKADTLREKGQFEQAAVAYQQAQKVCIQRNDSRAYLDVTDDLAACEYCAGHRAEALRDARLVLEKTRGGSERAIGRSERVMNWARAEALAVVALAAPDAAQSQKAIDESQNLDALAGKSYLGQLAVRARGVPALEVQLEKTVWLMQGKGSSSIERFQVLETIRDAFEKQKKPAEAISWFQEQLNTIRWMTNIDRACCLEEIACCLPQVGRGAEAVGKRLRAAKLRDAAKGLSATEKAWNLNLIQDDYRSAGRSEKTTELQAHESSSR